MKATPLGRSACESAALRSALAVQQGIDVMHQPLSGRISVRLTWLEAYLEMTWAVPQACM